MKPKHAVSCFVAGAVIVAAAALAAQEKQVWVNLLIDGKPVVGFVPAPDRSSQSQRGVSSEVNETDARTKDGSSIRAFEFSGWKEGEGYRILVFAVIATDDRGRPCCEGPGFKRVEFDDLRIKAGEEQVISKMKAAGVKPWMIRVGPQEKIARSGLHPRP